VNTRPGAVAARGTGADALARAVHALQARFEHIARTRMAGLPVVNAALQVQAVGFERLPAEPGVALGVLVTPWFMNLVRLPLDEAAQGRMAGATQRQARGVGAARIDFIGHDEAGLGRFECCSLFSPMQAFAEQRNAVEVAQGVLHGLRSAAAAQPEQPARRGFLTGRPRAEAP
jgi:[NiFe] hydrogenase assembly HybE family chaperone